MNIIYKKDNIFNTKCLALVNPVNCVGVMGKGLALEFKNRYNNNYAFYKKQCDINKVRIGEILVYKTNSIYIFNFPTKLHWVNDSTIEYIKAGMVDLVYNILKYNITSIAIPPLGCGNGNLKWADVKPIIVGNVKDIPSLTVEIYLP